MSDPLPDPSALPDHGVLSEPPLPSSDDMERTFRRFAGAALALAGSFCLWFALSTKLEADAEHAVTATWSPIAVKLYQELPAADSESERAEVALRGPLLPIRVDEFSARGRVDTRVFLALPPELRPDDPQQPPAMVAVLRYERLEIRSYGLGARGGDLTRERQGRQVLLYDLAGGELLAQRALECPDPLPPNHGDSARLVVQPAQILAALRDMTQG